MMGGLARKVAVAAIAKLQDAQRLASTQLKTSALAPKGVLYRMFSPPPLTWYQRRPHSNTTPGAYEWQTLSAERTSSTKLCPRQPLMACPFLKEASNQSMDLKEEGLELNGHPNSKKSMEIPMKKMFATQQRTVDLNKKRKD